MCRGYGTYLGREGRMCRGYVLKKTWGENINMAIYAPYLDHNDDHLLDTGGLFFFFLFPCSFVAVPPPPLIWRFRHFLAFLQHDRKGGDESYLITA